VSGLEFQTRLDGQLFTFHTAVVRVEWLARQTLLKRTARSIGQFLWHTNNRGLNWHLRKSKIILDKRLALCRDKIDSWFT
jgi:hypothetical protein